MLIPRIVVAGERETGTLCARCSQEIEAGEITSVCRSCGAVHHSPCWDTGEGCAAYDCSTASERRANGALPLLTVTHEELAAAEPLPTRSSFASDDASGPNAKKPVRRWNRAAVAAFALALLGIPLFGLVSGQIAMLVGCVAMILGCIAMVIGCIALAGHPYGRRGLGLGVAAIVIGLFDVIGWAAGLYYVYGVPGRAMVAMNELTIDPESLDELPDRIARAMRANVVVETGAGLGRQGLGSGVILKIRNGLAHIVTNRHMIDPSYAEGTRTTPQDLKSLRNINVKTIGEQLIPASVEWIAPHGIDLAIITAPILSAKAEEAHWDQSVMPHIGDDVFAVGNPHGLGWTHSAGDISQIRRQAHEGYNARMLQTTAAINPGNSGGGLYDSEGRLIGINTMTGDKRFAEGLGFSIALQTLMDLVPERLHLPRKNPEPEKP